MANYPTSVPSFTNKSNGQVIDASHINSLQDEVTAIGSGLLQGTAPLTSSNASVQALSAGNSTVSGLSVLSGSTFAGPFALTNTSNVTLSSGNTNDLVVSSGTAVLRFTPSANGSTLTGLSGGASGRMLLLLSVSLNTYVVAAGNAGSSVGNRFATPGNADITMASGDSVWTWYDGVSQVWRLLSNAP